MKRHRLQVIDKIIGVQTALASDKTPEQLKPGLRRYLKTLQRSRQAKNFLDRILFLRRKES